MPRPFLELTLKQWADLLVSFPWTRKITEVHVHHTFRPNHADFAARPPLQAIEGMFRFHTEERHFADIAQHITIDPAGKIWTGRNWNVAPASATGFNGNAAAGPFMFEMIGDFDKGRDKWTGAQKEAAIQVIARVQKLFGLPPAAFRFHNEMSTKSCPGTAIAKADVLKAVTQAHAQLAAPGATRSRAASAAASRDRDTTGLLLQMFNVQTTPRALETDGELPESAMALRDMAIAAGDTPAVSTRAGDADDLTAEDRTRLRKHVVNLRMGAFSSGGEFQTTEDDVRAMFTEHIPAFASRPQGQPLRLVFFAHGGLNDELGSLKNARNRIDFYLQNGCYPIFFVWETGAKETLVDILRRFAGLSQSRAIGDAITAASDPLFEAATRGAGTSLWINMKRSAEFSFLQKGGGRFVVDQLIELWKNHSEMEVHAIGHSAGAIFHAEFLDALCSQPVNPPVSVKTVSFLAPAITVDLFKEKVKPLVGGRIERFTEFTMHQDFELQDSVGPYGKSLLYLVSRAFEDQPRMPILGLEESLRADPDMRRFFGLGAARKGPGEIVFSVTEAGVLDSSLSRKHGDFDNDRLTMSGVMRRILASPNDAQVVEFPETVSRGMFDDAVPAGGAQLVAAPGPRMSAPAPAPANGPGRRRALCVGIDAYASPYQLAGCVNDAKDWSKALRGLGFETTMLVNDAATWQALRAALSDLVATARPGDVVVFQYAGHGTRVADLDGDEQGGMDSALCPVDFPTGGFLIDDDVRAILGTLADEVNFTCFFDCCHSGTITRMMAAPTDATRGASEVRIRGLRATPQMEEAHRTFRSALGVAAPLQRTAATMREVSFTACLDTQTAKEVGGHGQFTVRALPLLRGNLTTLTNGVFHERVVSAFGGTALDQDPQLDCAPTSKTRLLLAPLAGASAGDGAGIAAPRDLLLSRLDEIERRLSRLEQ